jgi:predicted 3-demethylubiquinone-9 3-methyltransferase (glyoxalase superfamily)
VLEVTRYGPDAAGPEGTIEHATFLLQGKEYRAIDKAMRYDFVLPSTTAIHVACRDDAEIVRLYETLREGGEVQMELGAYAFSDRFAWVADRYGVSWQLSLDADEA